MVLAIMGVLITIISLSLNRFNEQMKFTSDVQQELNVWYRFRSNLWKEFYHADSMKMETGELILWDKNETVNYKVEEDTLYRKGNKLDWQSTRFSAGTLRQEEINGDLLYAIDFNWKGELMTFNYLNHESPKNKIDKYFESL